MQSVTLTAQERSLVGKKVKKLRLEGLLPISVYGKDVKSVSLSVPMKDFLQVYEKAGETGLVELKLGGKSWHTLVANVQLHPVGRKVLHAEFHAVKLTEKIKANVPIETSGESPAVANNIGLILLTLEEIEVEALPTDLPEKILVDVSGLLEVGQQVTVGQLKVPSGVTVLTLSDEVVLKVVSAVSEETAKEMAEAEAVKAAAAAAEAGEVPASEVAGEEQAKVEETAEKGSEEG